MDNEKLRAEFESQMLELDHPVVGFIDTPWLKRAEGQSDYENEYVQGCWFGYQISRVALVVTLPNRCSEVYQDYFDDVEGGSFNDGRYIADMMRALNEAGITVKEGV